jgi:hypothetical protein
MAGGTQNPTAPGLLIDICTARNFQIPGLVEAFPGIIYSDQLT